MFDILFTVLVGALLVPLFNYIRDRHRSANGRYTFKAYMIILTFSIVVFVLSLLLGIGLTGGAGVLTGAFVSLYLIEKLDKYE